MTHPTPVSGSGRTVVAHHAVLVVDVLGTSEFDPVSVPEKADDKAPSVVRNLMARSVGEAAVGHLLLQLLGVPVAAGLVGD